MSDLTKKQMLYLSVHNGKDGFYIKFELEPYYRRRTRRIHTERVPEKYGLDNFDKSICLTNDAFLEDLGYVSILGLLVSRKLEECEAQIFYPHHRCGNPVLRIDEEPYEYQPHRQFCASIPLPSLDMSEEAGNEDLKRNIARTVLEYLPLVGFDVEAPEKV